jgi:hypothetical protein
MNIEPGIYRPEFPMDGNFTMVPNVLIRDPDLTPTAKLLMIYLFSHKIGYVILDDQIIRETGLGRHALRSARSNLEELGFIEVVRIRHQDNSWGGYRYELADPKGYFSTVDYSTVESSTMENRPDNRKLISKKTKEKKTSKDNTGQFAELFEQFWKTYPKKDDKPLAKRSFEKALNRATIDVIVAGAERYRDDPNRDPAYTKNASTWLNADAWENGPLPAPKAKRANWEDAADLARKYAAEEQQQIEYVNNEAARAIESDAVSWLKGVDDD